MSSVSQNKKVVVARGDGIGPEIMDVTLHLIREAGVTLQYQEVELGEKCYQSGHLNGISPQAWEAIHACHVLLKGPMTTPQGGGYKSLNVTLRTVLGLYANIRPCIAYAPFVATKHPGMNVVVVRENEEDLYTGLEYKLSPDMCVALKIITRSGSQRIIRYAFEYARSHRRKKVTCFTKDNILKQTDGLFHRVFEEIGREYPDLEKEHWIVDIGAAKLADQPNVFDVVVLPNLYGDILSDVAAQIAGSVGLAGSANIGQHGAMFEAIHGSAPRHAGTNRANPSGLILAAVEMLVYLGETAGAEKIHNAWLVALEEGIHTYDIYRPGTSTQLVGTREFGKAVAERLGQLPHGLPAVSYQQNHPIPLSPSVPDLPNMKRKMIGLDLFISFVENSHLLIDRLHREQFPKLQLEMVSNRGAVVWPLGHPGTLYSDVWRFRFRAVAGQPLSWNEVMILLTRLVEWGLEVVQVQPLIEFE